MVVFTDCGFTRASSFSLFSVLGKVVLHALG